MDTTTSTITPTETITITAWIDPIVEANGHHPRSMYVERFWLPVVGPTALLSYRRISDQLAVNPHGFDLDLAELARGMGMSYRPGTNSAFANAINRLTMFGIAHNTPAGIALRRRVPNVAYHHLRRLTDNMQQQHVEFLNAAPADTLDEFNRAHDIGLAMHHAGDSPDRIEHQLVVIGITGTVAAAIAANAAQLAAKVHR